MEVECRLLHNLITVYQIEEVYETLQKLKCNIMKRDIFFSFKFTFSLSYLDLFIVYGLACGCGLQWCRAIQLYGVIDFSFFYCNRSNKPQLDLTPKCSSAASGNNIIELFHSWCHASLVLNKQTGAVATRLVM